ncbi:ABC transporter ATP-binding protein [Mammaliicoccus sciuri]|uniref:ABC transporter ATP-binding protein n=2 Tax=Staphylococcaceae TaxID=90964 RepID=UPI000D1F2F8A|nr:ABC transporter ATP-binding protein [Mammaliicoccus sciuri]MCD8798456.1 ABC transporter ATP-binding protein [Mammaliicoccus sciuri]MCE4980561.1 ABC transporter ATP-binding protein [Mammaliicoccus sciuri]MCE5041212.1 ABC transporter ATP-binding protein [Mammaliicoccus sciuri]MCE5057272.1 ABC transporter ATP-binding protein [Mammaliicoccus sciuri]MCE5086621.1 ABC transporter ATP-binding protein [Mammaliicoccus sciuri]
MMVLLKVENLSKSIDNKKILDNLNFEINEGEIVGFIGENGAGKSTTFKTLLNLISKDEGLVLFFNEDLDLNINLKNKIGTVFDAINLPSDLTAKQLNNVFQEIFSEWNQNEYFDLLKEFDLPLNKKVSTLSRGMSMKLSVSISMAHNAKVLLLDEATGGLDPVSRNKLLEKLQVYNEINNGAILLSSHILGDVQKIATHLIILKKGKIILKDSKENIMQNYAVVEVEDSNIVEKNIIIYQTTLHNNKKKILISDRSNIPKNIEYKAIDLEEMVLLLTGGE